MPDEDDAAAKRERRKVYDARYRARRKERIAQSNREWHERKLAAEPEYFRDITRRWDARHRQERRDAGNARYAVIREALLERRRVERAANPEPFRERERRFYQRNAEKQRAEARAYRAANLEIVRAAYRRWEQANPEVRQAINNRRRQRGYAASAVMDKTDRLLSACYRKAIRNDPCFYCGTTSAERYHVDHYVPIVRGGTDHWYNLVRACVRCNSRKNTKHGDDFIAQLQAELGPSGSR